MLKLSLAAAFLLASTAMAGESAKSIYDLSRPACSQCGLSCKCESCACLTKSLSAGDVGRVLADSSLSGESVVVFLRCGAKVVKGAKVVRADSIDGGSKEFWDNAGSVIVVCKPIGGQHETTILSRDATDSQISGVVSAPVRNSTKRAITTSYTRGYIPGFSGVCTSGA